MFKPKRFRAFRSCHNIAPGFFQRLGFELAYGYSSISYHLDCSRWARDIHLIWHSVSKLLYLDSNSFDCNNIPVGLPLCRKVHLMRDVGKVIAPIYLPQLYSSASCLPSGYRLSGIFALWGICIKMDDEDEYIGAEGQIQRMHFLMHSTSDNGQNNFKTIF